MGMAASQARFLTLTARKSNVEYQGQQINQQRTALANESANLYSLLSSIEPPSPPVVTNYKKTEYSFTSSEVTSDKASRSYTFSNIMSTPDGDKVEATYKKDNYQAAKDNNISNGADIMFNSNGSLVIRDSLAVEYAVSPVLAKEYKTVLATIASENSAFYSQLYKNGTIDENARLFAYVDSNGNKCFLLPDEVNKLKVQSYINDLTDVISGKNTSGKNETDNDGKVTKTTYSLKTIDGVDYSIEVTPGTTSTDPVYKIIVPDGQSTNDIVSGLPLTSNVFKKCRISVVNSEGTGLGNTVYDADGKFDTTNSGSIEQGCVGTVTPETSIETHTAMYVTNNQINDTVTLDVLKVVKNDKGRITDIFVKAPQEDGTYKSVQVSVTATTVEDEAAYDQAMLDYEYQKTVYQQKCSEINAKTEKIQAKDKNLETKLKQLDTEQNALKTEMDAVQKVADDNVETTFKTFA